MRKKAIALISGGLDSTLAVRLMLDQGIEVVGVHFTCPLFSSRPEGNRPDAAKKAADRLGIKLRVAPLEKDYIEVVRRPAHGWGQAVNPCLDCHAHMIEKAKIIMEEESASFLVTGEVLGQRPKSQRREAMDIIDRITETKGILLRPLSAQHFEPTEAEKAGIVDREKLFSIEGRSRKIQMEMAKDIGIRDYPSPGGGCLLADRSYAARVFDLFERKTEYDFDDFNILKLGRLIRLNNTVRVVVGRNEEENTLLETHHGKVDALMEPSGFPGPSAAVLGSLGKFLSG